MEFLFNFVEVVLHLDKHLTVLVQNYGTFTYAFLFFIIFMETGFVVTPFLPGDSLLFATGAIASTGVLNLPLLLILLSLAAVLGDTVNYWAGRRIGPAVFRKETGVFLNKKYLERTHRFYEKYGGKAIIIARFIPIIRTFAPFVAGIGNMSYPKFLFYNVIGGLVWINLFTIAGYFFGNLPVVKHNFSLVIFAIIGLSILPIIIEFIRKRREVVKEVFP
ncbi:MAG: DedA family protein [bacterium]|nr:DedA family protein [bacterium]